jgi:hypothetical protein
MRKAISFAPTVRGPRSSMFPVRSMASSRLDFWTKILFPAAASGQTSAVTGNVVVSLPSRAYSFRLWVTPLESVSATTINGDDGDAVAEADGAVEGPQATRINPAIEQTRNTIIECRPV